MQEQLELLLGYSTKAWRFRYAGLVVAFLLAIGGWSYASLLPDVYRSSASLYVDPESVLDTLLEDIAVDPSTSGAEFFRVARDTLLSRSNLQEIIRATDMDVEAETEIELERLMNRLASEIDITSDGENTRGRGGLQQVVIAYEHQEPTQAYAVAKAAMDVLLDTVIGASQDDSRRGSDFLDRQISDYEGRLKEAEQRLKDFKRQNIGLMPSEGQSYFSQLQQVQREVADTRLALNEAIHRRDELKLQMESYASGRPTDSRYSARLAELNSRLADLTLRFTEVHPDVVTTREQIRQLLEAQSASDSGPADTTSIGADIANAEFRVELSKTEAEVASLQARLDEFERRRSELEGAVNTIPEVEAELQQLTRNYNVFSERYEQLVERRESARIAQDAALTGEDSKIRIVEPPQVPLLPVGPPRLLYLVAVLALAIGGGAAFALLLAILRPSFSTQKELASSFNLPVVGSINAFQTAGASASAFSGMGVVIFFLMLLITAFLGVVYTNVVGW